jgi:hypothetical protein
MQSPPHVTTGEAAANPLRSCGPVNPRALKLGIWTSHEAVRWNRAEL